MPQRRRDDAGGRPAHGSQRLSPSAKLLGELIARSGVVLYALELEQGSVRATYVSENITALTGFSVEEALRPGWWFAHLHPDDVTRLDAAQRRLAAEEELVDEYRFRRRDGSYVWIRDERRRMPGRRNRAAIVGTWTDVSETRHAMDALKEAMDRLAENESRYRALFEANPQPMWVYDLESLQFLAVNDMAVAHYGYSRAEFLAMTIADIRPEEDLPRLRESVARGPEGLERSGVWRHVTKRGEVIDVEITSHMLRFQGRPAKAVLATDITQRRRDEATLRSLSQAIEQSPVSIVITDATGAIEYVNPNFTRVTGYSLEEVKGQNPRLLSSGETPPETYSDLWNAITTGGEWRGLFHNQRKDGTRFIERAAVSAIRDASGAITHYVAVKEDITEQLALEDQLRQSQKLEALGRLAGGVAHDFNNMLSIVIGFAELAQERVGSGELHDDLAEIKKAAERSAALVSQLLAFARRQVIEPVVLDLNERVAGSRKMLERLVGESIDLRVTLAPDLWPIRIDPGQVDQVLANLVVNARDAIAGTGRIVIETDNVFVDDAYAALHVEATPGDHVMLAVSDSGVGMPPEIQARIFEPFFTTKPAGVGTGLGLPTVYGIVRQHAGFINVYSEAGRGTTFRLYLPRSSGHPRWTAAQVDSGDISGSETILLVEDSIPLLDLLTTLLKRLGYTVLPSATPDQALRWCDAHEGTIALLVTDVVLPDMSGRALQGLVSSRRPEILTLYMSGYTADIIDQHGVLPEGSHFLQKPISTAYLARKVREVLDSAGRAATDSSTDAG